MLRLATDQKETTMVEVTTAPVTAAKPPIHTTFQPIYHDQSETQIVLGLEVAQDDALTAAVTAGGPYFKVSAIDVCNWETNVTPIDSGVGELPAALRGPTVPARPVVTRMLSASVASSDGVKPLPVKKGQYARIWVTA